MLRNWLLRLSKKRSRYGLNEFLESEFRSIAPGSLVLIVGSAGDINDRLNRHAAEHVFTVQSLDIDPSRNPDIVGDICDHNGQAQYDVVVIAEVLEHVHSPHLGILTVFNALKPGGRVVLTTPFIFPIHDRPHDYYRFTKYGLRFLLQAFEAVDVRQRNGYFEAIDVLWMRLLMENAKNARGLSLIILPFTYYIKSLMTWVLSKTMKSDGATTGYNVTAIKPANSSK